jgi:von Willebrand factor type A domain
MTPSPRPAHRLWPAASLSLAIHGLIAASICYGPARDSGCRDPGPLAIDACAFALEVRTPSDPPSHVRPGPTLQPVAVVPTLTPPPVALVSADSPRILPAFAHEKSASSSASHTEFAPYSSGTGSAGGTGDGIVTAFFETPARGRSVVYVVDRSSSMGVNGALDAVKRELRASLDRLPPEARFQIVFYNRHAEVLSIDRQTGLLPATAANKSQAVQRLDSLTAEGSTEHLEALQRALSLGADVIYFLTDADDLPPQTVQAVTRLNQRRVSIHTMELTTANRGREDMPLQVLARQNRGVYRAVSLQP